MLRFFVLALVFARPVVQPNCPDGKCPLVQQPPLVFVPVAIPQPLPQPPKVDPLPIEAQFFFGVDEGKRPDRDRYMFGSREISAAEAHAWLEAEAPEIIPEDGAKPHLTLVGKDDAARKRLEAMLSDDAMKPVRDRYRVQVYDLSGPVDAKMLKAFALADNSEFAKTGTAAIIQPHSTTGTSKVEAMGFDLSTLLQLLSWLRSRDPLLPRPLLPTPTPEPPLLTPTLSIAAGPILALMGGVLVALLLISASSTKKG